MTSREAIHSFQPEHDEEKDREAPPRPGIEDHPEQKIRREGDVLRIGSERDPPAVIGVPRGELVVANEADPRGLFVREKIMLVVVRRDVERLAQHAPREQRREVAPHEEPEPEELEETIAPTRGGSL
jgi:hypothetical protein